VSIPLLNEMLQLRRLSCEPRTLWLDFLIQADVYFLLQLVRTKSATGQSPSKKAEMFPSCEYERSECILLRKEPQNKKSHCDQYFRFAVIKQFKIKLAFVSRDKKSGFMRVDQ